MRASGRHYRGVSPALRPPRGRSAASAAAGTGSRASPGKPPDGSAGRWPATALTRPQGCRPAAGTTARSAQRFGHCAEHQLHLLRLKQVAAIPLGKPWTGSAGRWPATALIPPHRDAGQRPALPRHQPSASATARKTNCICCGRNRRWTRCHASPGKPWTGSAGRWPATALIPPHGDAGQRPALPRYQPSASATARNTGCICSGRNRQWMPCRDSPGKPWTGSAGRWPATALIPPHSDAGQRPALPWHQPSASATARKTSCICRGRNR